MPAQGVDIAVELFQRFVLCVERVEGLALETVVDRGVRIEGKARRANHQDGVGGLHGGTNPWVEQWSYFVRADGGIPAETEAALSRES